MPRNDATAIHEAGHAVAARILGFEVVRAAAGEGKGAVTATYRRGVSVSEQLAQEIKASLVALAGVMAEQKWAVGTDEANAEAAALRITRLRHGGAETTDAMRLEASELLERLRGQAELLVQESWPLIMRVAAALAHGPLSQAQIDVLLEVET